MFFDESAKLINVKGEESAKIYKNVFAENVLLADCVTVGDDSRLMNSVFEEHVIIQRRNFISNSSIGRFTSTMMDTVICGATIGAFCSISYDVKVGGADHHYERPTTSIFHINKDYGIIDTNLEGETFSFKKPCIIGNDVWIATGAIINRGVSIGNGAVIGAGAVVTHDVQPYSIVVGNPAHEIKKRFAVEFIERINATEWWNLPIKVIQKNVELFSAELNDEVLKEIEHISNMAHRDL